MSSVFSSGSRRVKHPDKAIIPGIGPTRSGELYADVACAVVHCCVSSDGKTDASRQNKNRINKEY